MDSRASFRMDQLKDGHRIVCKDSIAAPTRVTSHYIGSMSFGLTDNSNRSSHDQDNSKPAFLQIVQSSIIQGI